MDFLYQKFSESGQKRALYFIELCVFLFALVVMVIGGFNLVYTTLHLGQLSGTLRIPLGYIYAIMPISGLLIMWFSLYHVSLIKANKLTN
jgi:TRAP-type C4-dicarboxylate transport system permease small subunit